MTVDVKSLAELARLALTEEEIARLTPELEAILAYAARIDALDTEAVPATRHAVPLTAPLRDDRITATLDRDAALAAQIPEAAPPHGRRAHQEQAEWAHPRGAHLC